MAIPFMSLANPAPSPGPHTTNGAPSNNTKTIFSLHGKSAIVTGGARGLGYNVIQALLAHGAAAIAIFDMNTAEGEKAVKHLKQGYPDRDITFERVDVTDGEAVEGAVERVAEQFGRVDLLLCFAGIVDCQHAIQTSHSKWRQMLDVNTTGPFICAQAAAKQMIKRGSGGSIVFIASVSGHIINFPQPQAAYNTAKAAVMHMTRCFAAEWATHGIRVNSISPGYMDTVLNEGEALEAARELWKARTPMGRMGRPDELDGVALLLCSEAGSYITGSDIKVDGGISVF